ncbi:MAG: amino acid ABC transporter permease [Variibacter sp.]
MRPYQWNFRFLEQFYPLFLDGLWSAAKLAAVTLVLSLTFGVVIGTMRSSRIMALRLPGTWFVEFFRNIPALVQIFWCYYAIPVLTGIQGNAFTASAVALTLYSTAYLAEIYRSGIQSIERGQWEAGKAIGLGYLQQMRYIIMPQAIRRMIPAFTNQIIEIIKLTTVASTIAYTEVLYYAKLLATQQYRPLESYTTAAVCLISILLVLSYASAALERRLRRAD